MLKTVISYKTIDTETGVETIIIPEITIDNQSVLAAAVLQSKVLGALKDVADEQIDNLLEDIEEPVVTTTKDVKVTTPIK